MDDYSANAVMLTGICSTAVLLLLIVCLMVSLRDLRRQHLHWSETQYSSEKSPMKIMKRCQTCVIRSQQSGLEPQTIWPIQAIHNTFRTMITYQWARSIRIKTWNKPFEFLK
ncbi:hypothetical protein FGIG_07189 [Fasciola gigantica]|uniref:Uncharacterized protein n=1 Tax=Fasciola gigantica TaxID=46835 RepID=A0A504YVN5_FASGI|nr:hypothetical protein FGIG_07189 [Fasciola gigantica]